MKFAIPHVRINGRIQRIWQIFRIKRENELAGGIMKKLLATVILCLFALIAFNTTDAHAKAVTTDEPREIIVDGETVQYEGILGKFTFDGANVSLKGSPSYLFESICYINLAKALKADPLASYKYNKNKRTVTVTRGNTTLMMYLDSYVAYLNGVAFKTNVKPKEITNPNGKTYIYCPGSFVFSNLLYSYTWDEDNGTSKVKQTYETGHVLPSTETLLSYKPNFKDTNYKQTFTLNLPDGIKKEDVRIEDDLYAGTVEIILKGDQRQYLRDYKFKSCSRCVLQITMKYRLEDGETRLCLFTRTNKDGLVLLHDDEVADDKVSLSFYRPSDRYDKIVLLDAGHGDTDNGASYFMVNEKDRNLAIMKLAGRMLEENGIKVFYTKTEDVLISLRDRAYLGVRLDADMFISIHHNAAGSESKSDTVGTSVYYSKFNGYESKEGITSAEMADRLLANLTDKLGTQNKGVLTTDFSVTKYNRIPAVLCEMAFMSNLGECSYIITDEFMYSAASALCQSVLELYE